MSLASLSRPTLLRVVGAASALTLTSLLYRRFRPRLTELWRSLRSTLGLGLGAPPAPLVRFEAATGEFCELVRFRGNMVY